MGFHPVLRAVANVCFTNNSLVDDIDLHPKHDLVMSAANEITGGNIAEVQRLNKSYNTLAYESGKDADLPDFLSYAISQSKIFLDYATKSDFIVIPTVAYKEAYRSLKVHDYKKITCIEVGAITSSFKNNSFEWSVFICVKNQFLDSMEVPETDYSTYNLNQEKGSIEHFRPLIRKLTPIYGSLAIPFLLYLFRYYRAVRTTNESPVKFNLPKGLEFLDTIKAKHVHKNEKMTNFLQKMLEIMANENILVP